MNVNNEDFLEIDDVIELAAEDLEMIYGGTNRSKQ
ncbi:hypothetical protein DFP86_106203 [Paludibacterium purpuratum]|uniref:Uncharacterized protein n=1 Tax=Paludibacterium purpuratum TaxID=1144873 RepID=A0A4R7B5V4_9NEIS|nr:hypothetical protein DFP86_106203 [Paludibacterium purpuratum]